jgi:hypothetical protein
MFGREDWEGAEAEKKTERTMRRNCQRTQHNNFGGKGDSSEQQRREPSKIRRLIIFSQGWYSAFAD